MPRRHFETMPRFYFDIREDDRLVSDDDGNDLPNTDAAEREAVLVAAEIASDQVKRGRIEKVVVEVRNEDGERVAVTTLTLQSVRLLAQLFAVCLDRLVWPQEKYWPILLGCCQAPKADASG